MQQNQRSGLSKTPKQGETMRYLNRVTLVSCVAAIGAFFHASDADAQQKSEVEVAIPAQPPGLDSHVNTVGITNELTRVIFEGLLTMNSKLEVKPALAESWTVSDDGKTYEFLLRKGVKFHDGSSLTATDVVASMRRWSKLSNPGKLTFSKAVWEADGDRKVVLKMPSATYKVLFTLANAYNQPATVMPASIAEASPDKPVRRYVGTGPYKLREWVPDQYLTLDRYDGYTKFEGIPDGWSGDRTPSIDSLKFSFISDDSTRVLGLQTDQYDMITNVPNDSIQLLMADSHLKVQTYPNLTLFLISNKATGLFRDQRSRHAVDLALNREDILYTAATSDKMFSKNHHLMFDDQDALWATDVGREEYNTIDLEKAKGLLKEVGYDGRELVMITSRNYSDIYNAAVMIQQQLSAIGMKVRLDSYDWPTFVEKRAQREGWDLMVINNTYKIDPTHWLHLAKDYAGFTDDSELDAILAKFETATDLGGARTLYEQLMKWHIRYIPASNIGDTFTAVAFGRRLSELPVMGGPIYWGAKLTN
jgi:peptide/nickel transport system substrate-binding protein